MDAFTLISKPLIPMFRYLAFFALCIVCARAQVQAQLTGEEWRLIELFRSNPVPYQALMYGGRAVEDGDVHGWLANGRTDLVEVALVSGKLSFIGGNGHTKRGSIRVVRGSTTVTALARVDDQAAVAVSISFNEEGVKLTWPDVISKKGGKGIARGSIVIKESPLWAKGDVIKWSGIIDTSSQSEELHFRVRYFWR